MNTCKSLRRTVLAIVMLAGIFAGAVHPGAVAASQKPAAVHVAALPASSQLGPLLNIPQTWNNCGPASVAEVLAYWGISRTQGEVQAVLRADGNPYGMSPYGVPAYMRSLGMRAQLGIDGNERLVKMLVSNGFPVIVSQYVSVTNHVGHYRPIQAYDDSMATFVSSDPYLGQGHVISYADFDAIWQSTNRRFLVLYPPQKQALLSAVLSAAGWNQARAYAGDLARTRGMIAGRVKDTTGYGSHRNWELNIAWDELYMGNITAAQQALAIAKQAGASPVVYGWVASEIARAGKS